jgi:hypothetical protein
MLAANDRYLLRHMDGLFSAQILEQTYRHFESIEASRQNDLRTETDEQRVRIGSATDALRFDAMWYEPWRHIAAEKVDDLRPFTWVLYPVQLRHVTAAGHLVPWHQDIGYVRRMKRVHPKLITCFVPLDPNPAQRSTLEFARGSFDEFFHHPVGDHGAVIKEREFSSTIHFQLAQGDAILFGDHVPHRTIPSPQGTIDRRSFEYRLVVPSDALDDKDYFDIESRCFVRTDGSKRDRI